MNALTEKEWTRCLLCINLLQVRESEETAANEKGRKEKLTVFRETMGVSICMPKTCTHRQFPLCLDCNSKLEKLVLLHQIQEKNGVSDNATQREIDRTKADVVNELKKKEFAGVLTASEDAMTSGESFTALAESILMVYRRKAKDDQELFDKLVMGKSQNPNGSAGIQSGNGTSTFGPLQVNAPENRAILVQHQEAQNDGAGSSVFSNSEAENKVEANTEVDDENDCIFIEEVIKKPRY